LTSFLPLAGPSIIEKLQIEGRPPFGPGKEPIINMNHIGPDYFQTMEIPLRAGRSFTAQDVAETPKVVIINETMARRFFANENPIGHRLVFGPNSSTIVGVAGDTRHLGLEHEIRFEVYLPYLQEPDGLASLRLVARVAPSQNNPAGLSALGASIRNQVRTIESNEPISRVVAMDERLSSSVAGRRFQMLLLGVFAAVALVIAAVGIYGVVSYAVSQQTHEIGIRMALGATVGDVLGLFIRQGMTLAAVGIAIGLAGAWALTRIMKGLLFGVSATDPLTFVVSALLLTVVAALACYLPARRAAKVDTIVALGTVVLSIVFGADGNIKAIRVESGLPYGLTEEAIKAARAIRFEPAMKDGKPVSVRGTLEIGFRS
jgi:putative ABC transport system permease protein